MRATERELVYNKEETMTIIGARRRRHHTDAHPPVAFHDYIVWLACPRCSAPKDAFVARIEVARDTPEERTQHLERIQYFTCGLCDYQIYFSAQHKREFLALYE